MIAVLISDDGSIFKVFDPKTKEDLTDKYELNALVIQTKDGKHKAGFHIGQDCSEQIEEAKKMAEDAASEIFLGGVEASDPAPGGRYNRG